MGLFDISNELEIIKNDGLYRKIPEIQRQSGKNIIVKNICALNCASNDYLGFSQNEEIYSASMEAIRYYGNSSGGSRVVSGNYNLYDVLEKDVADFKGYESCLVVNSGYIANLLIISTLASSDTIIFTDKLNHASIYDGIRLSKAKMVRYRHNDASHLEELLNKYMAFPKKIVVTDTIFSMDGDRAQLREIVKLKEIYEFLLVVDEAHGTGVFGKGRGLAHEEGVERRIDINMGTFSKALGGFGSYICAKREIIEYLTNKGRGFIYTTSLPPSVIGGNLKAVSLLRENYEQYGGKLITYCEIFRNLLKEKRIDFLNSTSQIFPIVVSDNNKALQAQNKLLDLGIYVAVARRPTVPTPRLRVSLRADFDIDDIYKIADLLVNTI
jgi:8-amino-7-oxononanoate synthase